MQSWSGNTFGFSQLVESPNFLWGRMKGRTPRRSPWIRQWNPIGLVMQRIPSKPLCVTRSNILKKVACEKTVRSLLFAFHCTAVPFWTVKKQTKKKNRLNTNSCSHYKSSAIAALTKEINKFVVVKKDDNSFSVFVSQDNRRHDW